VDVSHISKKSMIQAAELSKAPVILSHSGIKAVRDHARNIDDEQLQALKANGGVIQCVALNSFVKNPNSPERAAALEALRDEYNIPEIGSRRAIAALSEENRNEYEAKGDEIDNNFPAMPPATVQDYVNHIEHAINLIGIDHVAISSDFDGGGGIEGWNDASETFNVTRELVKRGYSEEDIRKIWGGNTLRIWREAERVAAEMQAGSGN
ncbi:membrane dipeptidase, partial [candidate division KSB1 bacterium]|nr:membrane dipeptidase [candidate division KSB1 bacterium]